MMVFMAIFFVTPIGGFFISAFWAIAILIIDVLGTPMGNTGIFDVLYPDLVSKTFD